MGQIIRSLVWSLCVYVSVCLGVCLCVCPCSHGRNFEPISTTFGTDVRYLKRKNPFFGGQNPLTVSPIFTQCYPNPCRELGIRSASANVLSVARSNLSFGSRPFRIAAPTVWNSLPPHVRSCTTLITFRKQLKLICFNPNFPLPSDPSQRLWFVRDHGAI